jgi:hypothetical protein
MLTNNRSISKKISLRNVTIEIKAESSESITVRQDFIYIVFRWIIMWDDTHVIWKQSEINRMEDQLKFNICFVG